MTGVYPRVGGGTSDSIRENIRLRGLSPRGRGNPSFSMLSPQLVRSIPAWAGEPVQLALLVSANAVYPRVGGGTALIASICGPLTGLSPRGRGNRGRC